MSKILMFAGSIGSGKAYCMNQMITKLKETGNSVCMLSFADPIKKIVLKEFGIDKNGVLINDKIEKGFIPQYSELVSIIVKSVAQHISLNCTSHIVEAIKNNDLIRDLYDGAVLKMDNRDIDIRREGIRTMMQIIGTDIAHTIFKEVWPEMFNAAIDQIEESFNFDYYIVDDFRFLMEYFCANRKFQHTHEIIPYYVFADEQTRADRRGITVETLREQSKHVSERESVEVLFPFMSLYFPNNIIFNGDKK